MPDIVATNAPNASANTSQKKPKIKPMNIEPSVKPPRTAFHAVKFGGNLPGRPMRTVKNRYRKATALMSNHNLFGNLKGWSNGFMRVMPPNVQSSGARG